MIFEGSNGCICFYWDDKLMTSAPLSKKLTLEVYEELSNKLILDGLKNGFDLNFQKLKYKLLLNKLSKLKKYKRLENDEANLGLCILALIKLKEVDRDDVMMIFPNKIKINKLKLKKKKYLPLI